MHQKKLKYGLLIVVSLIWGLILFRLIDGLTSDTIVPPTTTSRKIIKTTPSSDSFTLFANYPDPFLKEDDSVIIEPGSLFLNTKNAALNFSSSNGNTSLNVLPFDSTVIVYKGMISNSMKRKKIAMLTIAGRPYLASENQMITSYRIKKIEKDKVIITYNGSMHTIKIN